MGLRSLSLKDKLTVVRILTLVHGQAHQTIETYEQLRYGSNGPFRYGPLGVVKYSAQPFPDNLAKPLQKSNPNGFQDELIQHVQEDSKMSSFDFGVQFLDAYKMTYWGKRQDAGFWIENASVEWKESEASFHSLSSEVRTLGGDSKSVKLLSIIS
jgi:hypothetical protein